MLYGQVRISSVEALGEMVGLITRSQLKAALPRLIPTILDLYIYTLKHFFYTSFKRNPSSKLLFNILTPLTNKV